MRIPTQKDLTRLVRWQPSGGVISVYLDLQPEDRGVPWRIELRNGLAAARESAEDARAAAATAERVEAHLEAEGDGPNGRVRIGFAEVGEEPGREEWWAFQAPLPETGIHYSGRPVVGPLAAILERGKARGVAAVSAERVRLLCWSLAGLEELADWGLEIFSLDWRERKAQRSSDPARVQGAKASGHDQFDQRLEANRERFLHEAGRLAVSELKRRGCDELLVFGTPEHVRPLAEGAGPGLAVRALEAGNVISQPLNDIAERLQPHLDALEQERELALIERLEAEAGRADRGAIGVRATRRALAEGRVEHLVLAPGADDAERLVEDALETSAQVTQVQAEAAAEALADAEGVAALLRY